MYSPLDIKGIRQSGDCFCAQTVNVPAKLDAESELETSSYTESSDDQVEYLEDAHEEANGDEENGKARTIKPDHEVTDQSLPKLSYTYRTGLKVRHNSRKRRAWLTWTDRELCRLSIAVTCQDP